MSHEKDMIFVWLSRIFGACLPEHAENAQLALALAKKYAAHLFCTHSTLFAKTNLA
jgi:hypothetical protein